MANDKIQELITDFQDFFQMIAPHIVGHKTATEKFFNTVEKLRSLPSTESRESDTVEELVEKKWQEMFEDHSPEMCRYLLVMVGRLMVDANAATFDLSQESDLQDGNRYKIITKCRVKKVNN